MEQATAKFETFSAPPPRANRTRTGVWRRAVFFSLGVLACGLRLASGPWRRWRRGRKTILLIEPFGMGDVLSLQPLAQRLGALGYRVAVAAQERWRDLLCDVDEWIPIELPWRGEGQTIGDTFRRFSMHALRESVGRLRAAGAGAIGLDPRGDIRSVLLLYLAGCREVKTFTHYYVANDCLVLPGAARRCKPARDVARWRVNLAFIDTLPDSAELPAPAKPTVGHLLGHVTVETAGRVACIPMTPWEGKRWPAAHWRELVQGLRDNGWTPIGLCGPGESAGAEHALGPDVTLSVCTNVPAWIHALQAVEAVISVNTGPMHLADALDKRLVLINGSSRLPLWGPSGSRASVLHPTQCAPGAGIHEVGRNATRAAALIASIQPSEVLAVLGSPDARAP